MNVVKRGKMTVLCTALTVALAGCWGGDGGSSDSSSSGNAPVAQGGQAEFYSLMDQAQKDENKVDPYGFGIDQKTVNKKREIDQDLLAKLQKVNREKLSPRDQMFYDMFKWDLETNIDGDKLPLNYVPVTHFNNYAADLTSQVGTVYEKPAQVLARMAGNTAPKVINVIPRINDYWGGSIAANDRLMRVAHTHPVDATPKAYVPLSFRVVNPNEAQAPEPSQAEEAWYRDEQLPWLRAYNNYLIEVRHQFELGSKHGITLPQSLVDKLITQFKAEQDNKGNIKGSLTPLDHMQPGTALYSDYSNVLNSINRNYNLLVQYLNNGYHARAEQAGENTACQAGYCGMDDPATPEHEGREMYKWYLRKHTTTNLTPEQVHEKGLAEVDRIYGQMEAVYNNVHGTTGKPTQQQMQAFFNELKSSKYRYPNDYSVWSESINPDTIHVKAYESVERPQTDGLYFFDKEALEAVGTEIDGMSNLTQPQRDSLKGHYLAIYEYYQFKPKMWAQIPTIFGKDTIPSLDYKIVPASYNSAPYAGVAWYNDGNPSANLPGRFSLNTYGGYQINNWSRSTLLSHEAAPGHHFQITIAQELQAKDKNFPSYIKNAHYTSYVEGWALYTEYLADHDLGMYQGKGLFDPKGGEITDITNPDSNAYKNQLQYFGRLNEEMLRAMRLVVDTGIHWKGWSRDKAIDYMRSHSALGEGDINSEVPRYMAYVGQATSYKIGQLTIIKKRKDAGLEGPAFDTRGHDVNNVQNLSEAQKDQLKAFHRQVLEYGALPMSVFESKIDQWIAAGKPLN